MIYASMWITLAAYLMYPLSDSLVLMFSLSFLLGLGLGMSQPIILSLLHRLAPPNRAGEATGLRMSLVNFTQTFLPGALGAVGGALGLGTLFWGMAIMLGGAAWFAGRHEPKPADSDQQLALNPPSVPPAPPATPAPPTTPAPPATPAPPTSAPPQ
jgi:MFS family permease